MSAQPPVPGRDIIHLALILIPVALAGALLKAGRPAAAVS